MIGIVGDFGARRSLVCSNTQRRRSCSLPFAPFSDDDGSPRLSLSYQKLPSHIHHLCNLSVLKLDGSSFDVKISGAATVAELKRAIEDVFTQSPREDNQRDISWSHVWGHFCLCFEGQKLIDNKDYIQSFGIQDGCQLYFIRHLSINYDLMKRPSKKGIPAVKQHTVTLEGSDCWEEELCKVVDAGDVLEKKDKNFHLENNHSEDFISYPEYKLAHLFRGWLSYSNLCCFRMKKRKGKFQTSRFSGHFMKLGSKLTVMRL